MRIIEENIQKNDSRFMMEPIIASRGRNRLKGRLAELGYRQEDLCRLIGRSPNYVGRRINSHASFSVNEMRQIGKLLEIPEDKLLEYFS